MDVAEKQKIFEAIDKSSNPLIIIPQTLQGDAIEGSLALFLALKKIGKYPRIVCAGAVPGKFLFLSESIKIEKEIEKEKTYQLSFAVGEHKIKGVSYEQNGGNFNIYFSTEEGSINSDSLKINSKFKYDLVLTVAVHDLESLGGMYLENREIFSSLKIIDIDNSEKNSQFGSINVVDGYFSSVSEIVAAIIRDVLLLEYDKEIATTLLAGIIYETNNFQSLSITPETFSLTGALLASGAQRAEIIRRFYGIDFGIGNSDGKSNLLESLEAEDSRQEIKMIAAPAMAGISNDPAASASFGFADSFKKISRTFSNLWRMYFWFFLVFVFVITFFSTGNLNNFFLGINRFWTRAYASIGDVSEKISRETPWPFLPKKTSFDPIRVKNEVIYSAVKSKKISIGLPVKLDIPRLGVEAQILEVGLDKSGAMETPNNYKDVGWFKLGVRPGEIGNAVVTGHLDTASIADGVFRRLNELGAGDDVYVTDPENNKLHFRVIASRVYDAKNAPMEEIFGRSEEVRLNLITCDGVWDKQAMSYDKRLVVFTKLGAGI